MFKPDRKAGSVNYHIYKKEEEYYYQNGKQR